jgi:Tfp pilus assembly protein FimT
MLLDEISSTRSIRKSNAALGFSLVEIMIVMAFIAIVGSFSLLVSMDSYRSYNFYTERDLLISALHHARAQAVGNVCTGAGCSTGKPHGVSIQSNKFIVFQGVSYAARDISEDAVIPANASVAHGGLAEVVFTQLSGNSPIPGVITISGNGRSSNITIGVQGQIFWSN